VDKAPEAFRTISEVAGDLDVPQHVLRFWESRFREIKPMKRGGGRRYYRPEDVDLLRGIRHLLYGEGYTIRGVQRILREQGVKFVQAVWQPGAAQPASGPADEGDAAFDEAEESPAEHSEPERGRGLRGLLPSLLGNGERDAEPPAPPAIRREPVFAREPSGEPRVPPAEPAQSPVAPSPPRAAPLAPMPSEPPGLGPEDRRRLQSALDELLECRRLIDAALAAST
jgi:DNA-binding transcriptional MerR regulator